MTAPVSFADPVFLLACPTEDSGGPVGSADEERSSTESVEDPIAGGMGTAGIGTAGVGTAGVGTAGVGTATPNPGPKPAMIKSPNNPLLSVLVPMTTSLASGAYEIVLPLIVMAAPGERVCPAMRKADADGSMVNVELANVNTSCASVVAVDSGWRGWCWNR